MDSQRSLFKKFFGGSAVKSSNEGIGNNGNTGFNPPKFQFDKKKLGSARISSVSDKTSDITVSIIDEDQVMKEIETSEIEDSELKDHMDDFMDTTMNTTMNTTRIITDISVVNSPTIRDSVNTVKASNPVTSINTTLSQSNNPINTNNQQLNSIADLHKSIQQKNHQKYNLSNQLDQFNETIENALRKCGEKRNRMELLVLGIDEKIGKTAVYLCNFNYNYNYIFTLL